MTQLDAVLVTNLLKSFRLKKPAWVYGNTRKDSGDPAEDRDKLYSGNSYTIIADYASKSVVTSIFFITTS